MADGPCSVEGCEKPSRTRGWCDMHYMRWWHHGDPARGAPTPADRFWMKVERGGVDECWPWLASCYPNGYGHFQPAGNRYAHRFAYELLVGTIPEGLVIDHLCRNRACVNPAHLEPVTHAENLRRGRGPELARARQLAKTHCPHGHSYSGENLYVSPQGGRECRACKSKRHRHRRRGRGRGRGRVAGTLGQ